VLSKVVGPKKGAKLHDEELHGLCSSPNIIQVIQWVGHVVRTGVHNGIYTGYRRANLQGRVNFEEAGVDCGILKK
jgi:hypothetical protein